MELKIFIVNKEKKDVGKWIVLPKKEKEIVQEIGEICTNIEDTYFIKECESKENIDISENDNIYYLNQKVFWLNKQATDKEIQALVEIGTSTIDDLLETTRQGHYVFYPDKCMEDVAEELRNKGEYNYYPYLSEENGLELIEEDLWKQGYEETKTGVIYVY